MEIGQKCKLNGDKRVYKITNFWEVKHTLKDTKNELNQKIEIFVKLEEVNNSENVKTKVSITKIHPI